ncbi:hypothetical protein [Pseudomonas serbica]|uniref:hypothetical protein n=1 Tax=Pseudomonas serbica TaxID=2965074 RepID=UPI00237C13C2|nr:hypothetical protein [Pseudomonas serbica]
MSSEWHSAYKDAFGAHYWADQDIPTQDGFHEVVLDAANRISNSIKEQPNSNEEARLEKLTEVTQELLKQLTGTLHGELNKFHEVESLVKDLTLLRKIFSEGGPFSGVPILMPPDYQPFIFRITPIIHLLIKEPETFVISGSGGLPQFLADLELLRPGEIEKVGKLLGVIQGVEPTLSFDELMADVRSNIHDLISSNSRLASVQRRGGIEYLLKHDADVSEIIKKCDHSIGNHLYIGESIEPFTQIHRLTVDCLNHLEIKSLITPRKAEAIRQQLLSTTLTNAALATDRHDFDWAPMIKAAYTEGAEKNLEGILFLTYIQYTPANELNMAIIKEKVADKANYLKSELEEFCDKRVRNELVGKLGIEHLYTSNELLIMRGDQFAGDLGL